MASGGHRTHNPLKVRHEPSTGMNDLRRAALRDPPGRQPLILDLCPVACLGGGGDHTELVLDG
jgi:hypothetical protein